MTPPLHILRVIARLNVGGPAIQAITVTRELERFGWSTTLVRGSEAPREGNMDALAERLGVRPVLLPEMERELRPLRDLRAALKLRQLIRRERPAVLHTHTAKAGTVGRVAVILSGRRRKTLVVHTFHGHVLSGYFSRRKERVFAGIERILAGRTDVLIAVSDEVRDDILALGIGDPGKLKVVPLGFDLAAFDLDTQSSAAARTTMRSRLGVPQGATLVTLVARLVPIKRVDVFLAAAVRITVTHPDVWFCVAGDGELADQLRGSPQANQLATRLVWPGFVEDMPSLYAASDIVALCSDNEGTPVSLIEALASNRGVVSTRVGGVPSVVTDEATGLLVPREDPAQLNIAITRLVDDPELRERLGRAGRDDALASFGLERLLSDLDRTYRQGLTSIRRRKS